jgi:phosphoribosylaminoimidazolecarboxamide formyltransferase/IMP cyclohydrolase
VAELTGFPEILDGRVKTLHPRIHGAILADRAKSSHVAQLRDHGISPIDLVAVNLYPFRETAADASRSPEQVIDMIDIGGPCMVRAAAKNYRGVVVVVDPDDYPQVLAALEEGNGLVPERLRQRLAIKAFRHTQSYDAAISAWLESQADRPAEPFASRVALELEKEFVPRYGENPHQRAALYRLADGKGIFGGFEQLQGKELSFNNLLDADAARRLVSDFQQPTVAIVKHSNPCGVGRGESVQEAYERALECDPVSAFGSIVAVNRAVDGEAAAALAGLFIEVVIAPDFDLQARQQLAEKTALRLIRAPLLDRRVTSWDLRSVDGGMLAQTLDAEEDDASEWTCPTERQPARDQQSALEFLWKVVKHVKSNAVVVGTDRQTVGIGAGQMSRVDSCRLAIQKAQLDIEGCVAASDAFFPFPDGVELLAAAGVKAIVQPGGSKRDREVVEAADRLGVAMLFTATRHFKH